VIQALLGYLRRHDYTIFVVYRIALAIVIALLILTDARGSTF
jgi:undecaprenyl pyrophosphate phosphatase UppP